MSKNKDDIDIGFDPLAWMSDTETSEEPKNSEAPVIPTESSAQDLSTADVDEEAIAETIGQPEAESTITETKTAPAVAGDKLTINLAGKVDIASAEQLKVELSDALNRNCPVILAAADVERADGAGLQLLTAFVRKIEALDRELVWEEPSEQIIMAANIVGLKEALRLPG